MRPLQVSVNVQDHNYQPVGGMQEDTECISNHQEMCALDTSSNKCAAKFKRICKLSFQTLTSLKYV